jgi:pyridoxamine 5'-phosphate oxidase
MASTADLGLREAELDPDPIAQFQRWFQDALATGSPLPEAMTLATATPDGIPSARMVLCKGVDQKGFTFFTNYQSEKGKELAANPRAALVFYWAALGRQVRVSGRVSPVSVEQSDSYFDSRPLASRLSAAASPQSDVVESRSGLEQLVEEVRRRSGATIQRPDFWGGYRVHPEAIEFWLHRDDRLHDRIRYRRQADGSWLMERLAP